MAEMTAEERAKARLEKFKQAKAKADADSSGFPKEEVPDFQCCVLKKDTPKIIRLVGNAPSMREVPSDALIVKRSMCIDDNGDWATIVLSDDKDHPINKLFRTIIGKYQYNKETKVRTYNNKGKPSFERFMRNGKSVEECGTLEQGMQPTTYYMFNCIDKTDNWCKENKHTKLLCWDSKNKEVDGKIRTYYTYGVKPSFFNEIFDTQCTKLNRHYEDFDFVAERLSKKIGDSYLTVCIPEEQTAIKNMGIDPSKVSMDYLSEEEEKYERYNLENIPFVTKPTYASYFLKVFSKLIKQADIDFNNGEPKLYNAFVEWKEKELEEMKKLNAEKGESSETTSDENTPTVENEVTEETSVTTEQSFDSMEEVETSSEEDLPTEVEEPTPTVTKKIVKVASTFDPLSLSDKFPYIGKLREEDKKLIIGYDTEKDELKFAEGTELAECPCSCTIGDSFNSCPKCGAIFES